MTEAPGEDATVLFGIAAAHGVVMAPAVVLDSSGHGFVLRHLKAQEVDAELERFERAVETVQADMIRLVEQAGGEGAERAILDAYRLMAGDPILREQVRENITTGRRCAIRSMVLGASNAFARI